MSAQRQRLAVWTAAAAILAFRLFVPPILGLSDQGDFARMIGRFGYAPQDKSSIWDAYVKRKYIRNPASRYPTLEQPGAEYLFVAAAIALSRIFFHGVLDIRVMGFVHLAAFLAAFAYLLKVTQPVRGAPLVWLTALLIATDAGYAAYWNSFYAEPATCIFLLLLVAESVAISVARNATPAQILRWSLWAALLVDAKAQNLSLAILLAPFALSAFRFRRAAIAGCALILLSAAFNFVTLPDSLKLANTYNVVFLSILPESHDPQADLRSMHADPALARFSGTGAWSPGTAFYDLMRTGAVGNLLNPPSVARFYLFHPARIWRHARALLPNAFSLRPEWCGNFERSAGQPPGAKNRSLAFWSAFHERALGGIGRFILIALVIAPSTALFARNRLTIAFLALLSLGAIVAFSTAALGDAWDNVKHMYLFNLLVDTLIVSLAAITFSRIARTSAGAPPDPLP